MRQRNTERYRKLFNDSGLVKKGVIGLPAEVMNRNIYNHFVIRVQCLNELQNYLKEQGLGTEINYPALFHKQECFTYLKNRAEDFPESNKVANKSLAPPI